MTLHDGRSGEQAAWKRRRVVRVVYSRYLAAGRPVITQDTAFGNILPLGEGLFAFTTMAGILAALEAINANYVKHSAAARGIAEGYFRAEKVLANLIDQVGIWAVGTRLL